MKNIKDITLSIFAIIGFVAILSSFNNQTHDTVPESHAWEFHNENALSINKVTGEVRKYNTTHITVDKNGVLDKKAAENIYAVMVEAK